MNKPRSNARSKGKPNPPVGIRKLRVNAEGFLVMRNGLINFSLQQEKRIARRVRGRSRQAGGAVPYLFLQNGSQVAMRGSKAGHQANGGGVAMNGFSHHSLVLQRVS